MSDEQCAKIEEIFERKLSFTELVMVYDRIQDYVNDEEPIGLFADDIDGEAKVAKLIKVIGIDVLKLDKDNQVSEKGEKFMDDIVDRFFKVMCDGKTIFNDGLYAIQKFVCQEGIQLYRRMQDIDPLQRILDEDLLGFPIEVIVDSLQRRDLGVDAYCKKMGVRRDFHLIEFLMNTNVLGKEVMNLQKFISWILENGNADQVLSEQLFTRLLIERHFAFDDVVRKVSQNRGLCELMVQIIGCKRLRNQTKGKIDLVWYKHLREVMILYDAKMHQIKQIMFDELDVPECLIDLVIDYIK